MDRLITVLAGLVLGLRGARRFAFEAVLEGLREFAENFRTAMRENEDMSDILERVQGDLRSALKDMVDEKGRADALQRRIDAISRTPSLMGRDGGVWCLMVRRRLLSSHKINVIKALRAVTALYLKEAKEWVDARSLGPTFQASTFSDPTNAPRSDDWIVLSDKVDAVNLLLALDVLLNQARMNQTAYPPTLNDVSFRSPPK